ncbi:beta-lactamase class A [Lactobacillus colini]|uniref:Beta-lactamase class A n=1 Tax=Lactobacillus colini TaxID=1819254 RepID=A0ABS4MEJ4_9LACO|nr:serine hydrolase [Lactobacillus colini]MBP2058048.1 beta-lactamase class A [Lactobacillus colini]
MKNKIFFGSALVAFCSLAFYMTNINRIKMTKIEVYNGNTTKVTQHKQSKKSVNKAPAPKKSVKKTVKKKTTSKLTIASGSNKKIVKDIKKQLADQDENYQVSFLDLDKPNDFARVANNNKASLQAKSSLKFYLLLAYENAVKSKKIIANYSYKIKSSDQLKSKDKMLQTGLQYSYTYIRDMMINQDSDVAANILLNKIGRKQVNKVAKKFGATNTEITGKFGSKNIGQTSAYDMTKVMKSLYQGKVLGVMHDTRIIGYLIGSKNKKLTAKISGRSYSISGPSGGVALVEVNGKNYALACINEKADFNYESLGEAVNSAVHKR